MRTRFAWFLAVVYLAGCAPVALPPARQGGEAGIASFGFLSPPVEGKIDAGSRDINLEVPDGTDCTRLVAVYLASGDRVTVEGVEQQSGVTANDFSQPVVYVVEGADGSSAAYTVRVEVLPPLSGEKSITSFAFLVPSVAGAIDEAVHGISVTVPHGTDRSSLTAAFSTSGVLVTVADTEQQSGVTINDFTDPVTYLVTAEDGSTQGYSVTVMEAPSTEKSLTAFGFVTPGCTVAIDEGLRIIRARAPAGTDLAAMVAVFSTTGAQVRVAGQPQESGVTVNDFSGPVAYEVVAEDGSSVVYAVRVADRSDLVINELDVDQVGVDTAEFIELYASGEVDLWGIVVILLNGSVTPGQEYGRIDLSSVGILEQGSHLVIAGSSVVVQAPGVKLTPSGWESSNRIQNGPNDAVLLWDTLGRGVVDTVSYAGVLHRAVIAGEAAELDATEGSAGAPADSNSLVGSISRSPNGQDTGQNGTDLRFTPTFTPGTPNL